MFLVEHVKTISTRMIEGRAAYEKQQMIQKVSNNTKKVTDNNMLNCEENWRNKNKLRETLELNITEDTFSEISLNTIEEKLKQFKNNAEEREILHESESSKEIILPNVSMSSDLEPKSTVVVIDSSVDECSEDALKLSTNINLSFSKEISTKVNNSLNWSEPKFHSTPVSLSNFSYEQKEESSYSIVLNEQPIPFKICETKIPLKRKYISNSDSYKPVKRGKYVNPLPGATLIHQNAVSMKSKITKKRKMIENGSRCAPQKVVMHAGWCYSRLLQ
ncbi:uncharacterized protein LOC141528648 [Cotesia typhae]|uniref:uncharacterized protein LOC141528648 n=1 Tax=Cotesia typhae TaxID=2053667 RepID=UPI003D69ED30